MSDKEALKRSKQQPVDSEQWTGDPEPIKPPLNLAKRDMKLLFAGIVVFFVDLAWMFLLESYSPKVMSLENGKTVMLQIHSRIGYGLKFYVHPFEAYVHYALSTVSAAALAVFLFRGLTKLFRKQG